MDRVHIHSFLVYIICLGAGPLAHVFGHFILFHVSICLTIVLTSERIKRAAAGH